jgi:hypothetical protein
VHFICQNGRFIDSEITGMKHQWYLKLFNFIFFLGAAVTAVLGIFSSIKGIIAGFEGQAAATAFGCQSPVIG